MDLTTELNLLPAEQLFFIMIKLKIKYDKTIHS